MHPTVQYNQPNLPYVNSLTPPYGMQISTIRQGITKIVGCSREMTGRVLTELEQDELISARGKRLWCWDPVIFLFISKNGMKYLSIIKT